MSYLIDRKSKIIMGFSAKGGCTVVVKMFLEHMGLLQEALEYNSWVHHYYHQVFIKKYGEPTVYDFRDKEYFKFKVVRNPYDRAISSYLKFLEIKKTFCSFANFLEELKKINLTTCDKHWAIQADGCDYNKIVKIENIKSDIAEINNLLQIKFNATHTSNHHHIQSPPKKFIGYRTFG